MRQFVLLQIIEISLRWSQVKSLEPLLKLYKEPLIIYRRWGGGGGGGREVDDFSFLVGGEGVCWFSG